MKRFIYVMSLLMVLLGLSVAVSAQPRGRWEYLGEANVDGGVDHDSISVTAAEGRFRAIQIKVQGGAIRFDRVIVHYGNGQQEPLQIRARIPAGGQTRAIDLPGERRVIQSVEFYYERGNWRNNRRPKVRLFGIR